MPPIDLNNPIEKYPRLQQKLVPALERLGIHTIKDLLYHLPFRYDNFSEMTEIENLAPDKTYTVHGQVVSSHLVYMRFKQMTIFEAVIQDDTGTIRAQWYNQPFLARAIKEGVTANFSGKVKLGKKGLFLSNPTHEITGSASGFVKEDTIHTGRLVPVYPETSGLSSRWLRFLIYPLLDHVKTIKDTIPADIRNRLGLMGITSALLGVHFPETLEEAAAAKRRIAFDEVFMLHLLNLSAKQKLKKQTAPIVPFNEILVKQFVSSLPFTLTGAQRASSWEIIRDMGKSSPMNRLLQGDVGSGKTVVAAIAILNAASTKLQTAFLAPTEILAHQHFTTLSKLLAGHNLTIGLLTASSAKFCYCAQSAASDISKKSIASLIKDGEADIVLGTHALLQKTIVFKKLGLIVVDEQHRFGVEQRAQLAKKHAPHTTDRQHGFEVPHFLSMTATPIPRTLALTVYGDLDISILNEMPPGRKPVITKIIPSRERASAYAFIKKEIEKGRQAFVICPRIESSTKETAGKPLSQRQLLLAEVKAVKAEYEKLSKEIFPGIPVAMLHGKMKAKEKEETMKLFAKNETKVLVSTSVIEVGVDIPNATIMMIEGAERFGLAQLHQFRGRVGRREHQSYCFLFPESLFTEDNKRLRAMTETQDGFVLAQKDLAIRGPGDFSGLRQSGFPDLIMESLGDTELIKNSRDEAQKILEQDPDLARHPLLRQELAVFTKEIHLE